MTQAAQAANYPFCTIDPIPACHRARRAIVGAQDIAQDRTRFIPRRWRLVDIAGLVKGASQGEGKGNAFLSAIKNVDAVLHVVRCFDDPDVIHVDGSARPGARHRDHRPRTAAQGRGDGESQVRPGEEAHPRQGPVGAVPTLEKVLAGFKKLIRRARWA